MSSLGHSQAHFSQLGLWVDAGFFFSCCEFDWLVFVVYVLWSQTTVCVESCFNHIFSESSAVPGAWWLRPLLLDIWCSLLVAPGHRAVPSTLVQVSTLLETIFISRSSSQISWPTATYPSPAITGGSSEQVVLLIVIDGFLCIKR